MGCKPKAEFVRIEGSRTCKVVSNQLTTAQMTMTSKPRPAPSAAPNCGGSGESSSKSTITRKRQLRHAQAAFRKRLRKNSRAALLALQNADKFLQREGWTRGFLAKKFGQSTNANERSGADHRWNHEKAWNEIGQLRATVIAGKEPEAYLGASVLAKAFEGGNSFEDQKIFGRCTEIMRDSGQWGMSLNSIARIAALGNRVIKAWALQREYFDLSFSLLTLANLFRINADLLGEKGLRRALRFVDGAEYILEGKCRTTNRARVTVLQHHATWLRIALTAYEAKQPEDVACLMPKLCDLASEIGTRSALLKSAKEEADYYTAIGDFDRAQERIMRFRALAGCNYQGEPLVQLGLWRPEIELNLAMGRKLQAQELLTKYIALFKRYPYGQHENHLLRFRAKYHLTFPMPKLKTRQSPFLIYPYLERDSEGLGASSENPPQSAREGEQRQFGALSGS